MAQKTLINSPIINELVFDYLFTMTLEQRKMFTPKELRFIRTAKRARQFIDSATIDEKLLILAKLGVQFSFIIHREKFAPVHIKEWYEKYKEMSTTDFLKEMTNQKIVVLNDRILVNFLNIMATFSHSDSYLLNLDFHKVGYFINNWKKIEKPNIQSIQESLEYAKIINRLSLNVATELKAIKGETETRELDIILLMYLYENKSSYVGRETIINRFSGLFRKTVIGSAIKRLQEKLLIDRNPIYTNIHQYQITSLGNTAVMDFHRKNLSLTV